MVNCPVCDAAMDVEEDELDEGDELVDVARLVPEDEATAGSIEIVADGPIDEGDLPTEELAPAGGLSDTDFDADFDPEPETEE